MGLFRKKNAKILKPLPMQTEKCVCCGKDTGISADFPIEKRLHYIHGCGQLCEQCHDALHYWSEFHNDRKLTEEQLLELLEKCRQKQVRRTADESTKSDS